MHISSWLTMRLNADIVSRPLLHAKGWLFLLLGLMGAAGLCVQAPGFKTFFLLAVTVWASCRFYYYLFYVLERYLGRGKKYAGLGDALGYFLRLKKRSSGEGAALIIRPFDAGKDHAAVVALWSAALDYGTAHNAPGLSIRKKMDVADGLFFIAVTCGRLVGTVMAGCDGHRGWVYSLAVEPGFRNQGIGRALIRQAEASLRELGCVKINLQIADGNQVVAGFYEKMGYTLEPRTSMGKVLHRA